MPGTGSAITDDEIEFVAHNHPYVHVNVASAEVADLLGPLRNKFLCQLCSLDLTQMSARQRGRHYEEHLSDEPQSTLRLIISLHLGTNINVIHEASGGSKGGYRPPATSFSAKSPSKSSWKPVSKAGFKALSFPSRNMTNEEKNVFWHALQTTEPPHNFSPGKPCCIKSHFSF